MASVRVGLFPAGSLSSTAVRSSCRRRSLASPRSGVDHLCVGDHVSFFVGRRLGRADHRELRCSRRRPSCRCTSGSTCCRCATRSPSPGSSPRSRSSRPAGSRSASGSAARTPTRSRSAASTRRRVDAGWTRCLQILRGLADGTPVTFDGEFFSLEDALIVPAPSPPIPLIVGGRSDAAVSRAARLGDGWLGIWVSPRRYAAVRDQIAEEAAEAGRDPSAVRARAQRLVRLRRDA